MADTGVLVVGGAGYFGARLAEALAADRSVTLTWRSLPSARAAWLDSSQVAGVAYDSARDDALPVTGRVGAVVNLAMPGAKEASADPEGSKARALKTIDAILALLDEGRADRVVHFSTFHVYGGAGAPDYAEDTAPRPIHPYGEAHALVEERIAAHAHADRVTVLRPTNMVGAPAHADLGDQAGLIFLDLCRQAVSGRMELRNDGRSYRDILAFPDAIAAVRLAIETPSTGGQVMNLAAGEAIRLDALAQDISAAALAEVTFGDGIDAFREPFQVSINRLRAVGWAPTNDLGPEIAHTLAFFR
ncbi:NAD-dependent epimerase/dehydratase family protein [Mameliella alba]|uniref:UDP-glucose 4-epimerase n=1 Tax=Mameliella alba TaxID=561184 RepID=A0A0B3RTR9_9RHOB|nr:NAD(P)-dependent oxidoreductase [Mameliella alba]KHQ50173.1 UDP-glucose 4-epimerase [Mameliella alba]